MRRTGQSLCLTASFIAELLGIASIKRRFSFSLTDVEIYLAPAFLPFVFRQG